MTNFDLAFDNRPDFDAAVSTASAAAKSYYAKGGQPMADATYDALVDRIEATVALHPDWDTDGVTTKVAAGQGRGDIPHPVPMQSLRKEQDTTEADNAINAEVLNPFFDAAKSITGYNVEVKLDGLAVRAVYRNGIREQVVTRGDGNAGDDVTAALDGIIDSLPSYLPSKWSGEVRGEVYMTFDQFDAASFSRVENGGTPFANPRNATSGVVNSKTRNYTAALSFAAYSATGDVVDTIESHAGRMEFLAGLGFTTAAALSSEIGAGYRDSVASAKFALVAIKVARVDLPYPIDGAVVSYDTMTARTKAGEGSRAPKWAVAWKYPPLEVETTLRDVSISIGRTGRMSLVAHIDPVYVAGSTISRASGHNPMWMQASGMGIGSRVMIRKRGDIIPYISLLDGEQPDGVTTWVAPDTCPTCDEAWDKSSMLWRCHTPTCSLAGTLTHFASRNYGLDIDRLGSTICEALAELKMVENVADLYALTFEQWATLPLGTTKTGSARQLGEANASQIMASLENTKTLPFHKVLTALGIRHLGRTAGPILAAEFKNLDALRAATVDQVATLDRLGPVKAEYIVNGLDRLADVIDRLATYGLTMAEEEVDGPTPLAGMNIVVSGSVPGYTRPQVQDKIRALGGNPASSVSKNTTYLVVDEDGEGSSKGKKAKSLGVEIIRPERLLDMLG